jgi:diguanylate cyclase (GGDEF)-like protein
MPDAVTQLTALLSADVAGALPYLAPIADSLECGFVLVINGRIVVANQVMGELVGLRPSELVQLGPTPMARFIAGLVDDPPALLRDGCMFPIDGGVVCEEFEIVRPVRSVVRWVARSLALPDGGGFLATCTDITTEVDLAAAQERLALTDPLSGLVNRRGMQDALARELARAKRIGAPTSVLLIDIDRFKQINDAHGHAAGDDILRLVSKRIVSATRSSDTIARWGGEEFLVLLPDTPLHGAHVCAEHIRAAVEAMEGPVPVTVSLGTAQFEAGETAHLAISRADAGLYQAKMGGRNRVV